MMNNTLWKDAQIIFSSMETKNLGLKWIFKSLYWVLYVPLFMFYLSAPNWLGGWEGKEFTDICSYDTNIEAKFWSKHPEECQNHIQKLYNKWLSPFFIIIYFIFLGTIFARIIIPIFLKLPGFVFEKVKLCSDHFSIQLHEKLNTKC